MIFNTFEIKVLTQIDIVVIIIKTVETKIVIVEFGKETV